MRLCARRLSGFLVALLPLLPLVEALPTRGLPPASDFYVKVLPGLKQDPLRPLHIYAGHLPSDPRSTLPPPEVTSHLFFALIKARRSADKERIIFWFNGGPGCSSFDGLMMEVGPWRVDKKGGLEVAEGGWEEYANIVFVDQPAGTGLSYVATNNYLNDLSEVGPHMIQFFKNFYSVFPEYATMDTYLAGESFAGQYIPYIATSILSSDLPMHLIGIAIGNGWIDGRAQYPAYVDFALRKGLLEEGSESHKAAIKQVDTCMADYKVHGGDPVHVGSCEQVMGIVINPSRKKVNGEQMCLNIYDVRLFDTSPSCGLNWPPDLAYIYPYLRRQDVLSALHASIKAEGWMECNTAINQQLSANNKSPSSITLLPALLSKISVLLFAGDEDLICNYIGMEKMMENLTWNGAKGLGEVSTETWTVNGTIAGTWVNSRNLTYTRVFNASHMVGFDLPHVAHDMMLRFMGVDFAAISEGSALIPSAVGGNAKPIIDIITGAIQKPQPNGGKTPEQNKAMWEAYYNAGSAALILVLISLAIGVYFLCRRRRRHKLRPTPPPNDDERIPLREAGVREADERTEEGHNGLDRNNDFQAKGKAREAPIAEQTLFEVGSDDEHT